MKKFLVVSLVALVCVSAAYAFQVTVPFFLDNNTHATFPPAAGTNGSVGLIGIRNNTAAEKVIALRYFPSTGGEATPDGNTFLLAIGEAVSWRPWQDLAMEGAAGQAVPNMTGTKKNGTCAIIFMGTENDIQGRYMEVNGVGIASAYLLPPGIPYLG